MSTENMTWMREQVRQCLDGFERVDPVFGSNEFRDALSVFRRWADNTVIQEDAAEKRIDYEIFLWMADELVRLRDILHELALQGKQEGTSKIDRSEDDIRDVAVSPVDNGIANWSNAVLTEKMAQVGEIVSRLMRLSLVLPESNEQMGYAGRPPGVAHRTSSH